MYEQGNGVAPDYAEAVKWYRKAAQHGYVDAEAKLGAMYFNGDGVGQNYSEALRWLSKAARHGSTEAAELAPKAKVAEEARAAGIPLVEQQFCNAYNAISSRLQNPPTPSDDPLVDSRPHTIEWYFNWTRDFETLIGLHELTLLNESGISTGDKLKAKNWMGVFKDISRLNNHDLAVNLITPVSPIVVLPCANIVVGFDYSKDWPVQPPSIVADVVLMGGNFLIILLTS